jgi:pre-mRNA-processing factor 40
MKSIALKKQADEKRRAERKQRHLQDDLRYALKKLPEPLDISLSYEEVSRLVDYKGLGLIALLGCIQIRSFA